jgi:hypothetical protein
MMDCEFCEDGPFCEGCYEEHLIEECPEFIGTD